TISEIGYGKERRYSPTVLRNCRADQAEDVRILMVRCLANFGYSGSPILAEVNGTPTVIGIFSPFQPETREMFACSAGQFEETLKQLIKAQLTAHHSAVLPTRSARDRTTDAGRHWVCIGIKRSRLVGAPMFAGCRGRSPTCCYTISRCRSGHVQLLAIDGVSLMS